MIVIFYQPNLFPLLPPFVLAFIILEALFKYMVILGSYLRIRQLKKSYLETLCARSCWILGLK